MPWIYAYLDGARNETEMGLYDTGQEAEENRKRHASFGAITRPISEVPKGYQPLKPDYDKD